MWSRRDSGGLEYFAAAPQPRLELAFLTRRGGVSTGPYESLNLSFRVGDDKASVEENLRRVRAGLHLPVLATVRQIHSDAVLQVRDATMSPETVEADALFTDRPGVALAVKVADCLPVFVWSRDLRGIGIAHCGWRGTAAGLAENLCRQISRRLAVPLPDLCFSLGPCICWQCYTVGADVVAAFDALPDAEQWFRPVANAPEPKWRLCLRKANDRLLRGLGLASAPGLELCSRESTGDFFSVRRSSPAGRNLALITLRF
jgi:hypothetical protein